MDTKAASNQPMGAGFDASIHNAEKALFQQKRYLETLNRVAQEIAGEPRLDRIVQMATDAATELSGARFGAFFYNVNDQLREGYRLYALSGAPPATFDEFCIPGHTGVLDPGYREPEIIRSDDIRSDFRYGDTLRQGMPRCDLAVVSYMAAPVVSRSGAVHGTLFLGHELPGIFTLESEQIVAVITAHAAIAIENSHRLKAAEIEIEQLRRTEFESRRLAAIVESSHDAIIAKDLNGIVTSWNQGAERLFGYAADEVIGKPVTILIPGDRRDEEAAILARLRRGERVDHYETIRRRKDGSLIEISLTVSPIKNADEEVIGASKIARDISGRKRAEDRQRLLVGEMAHRVRNLIALASSVVSLSARWASTPDELAEAIQQRLGALARAHDLTFQNRSGTAGQIRQATTLRALIQAIFAPYSDPNHKDGGRVAINGSDILLGDECVTSFALLLHEFATNAAKYGSLSMPGGYVQIGCSESGDRFVLTWKEVGGPPLHQSDVEGFGTMLSCSVVKHLGGEISREWKAEGLTLRLTVPKYRLMS